MDTKQNAVTALLRRSGMYAPDIDFKTIAAILQAQMRISFYGGESSAPVRPTGLSFPPAPAAGARAAVALADRSELRVAALRFTETGWDVTPGEAFPVPGADYPASLEDLLFAVAELTEPMLQDCDTLCLCLDFALTPQQNGDCAIEALPQNFALHDWAGRPLAEALRVELESRGLQGKRLLVCSAAAATLLDGFAAARTPGRYFGLRWGRGLSLAFAAPKSAVVKLRSGEKTLVLFDVGAGGFTGVPCGVADLTMDRDSERPGFDLLEKMISTAFLGERFRFTMIEAVEERLLTFMCGRDFLSLRRLPLETLLQFLTEPEGENQLARFCSYDAGDRAVALAIGHAVLDRAARLAAASLAAALRLTGAGLDAAQPAIVSLSGEACTAPLLRQKLTAQLAEASTQLGLHALLRQTEPPCVPGAAALLSSAL